MDFSAHYSGVSESEQRKRDFELKQHNHTVSLISTHLPLVVSHVHRQPPTKCDWITVDRQQVVAWELYNSCWSDDEKLYLLPNGTIIAERREQRIVTLHTVMAWEDLRQAGNDYRREVSAIFDALFKPGNIFNMPGSDAIWARAMRGQPHRYYVNDRYNGVNLQPAWLQVIMRHAIDNLESFDWHHDRYDEVHRSFAADIQNVHCRKVGSLWLLRYGGIVDDQGNRVNIEAEPRQMWNYVVDDLKALANLYKKTKVDYHVDIPEPPRQPKSWWRELVDDLLGW